MTHTDTIAALRASAIAAAQAEAREATRAAALICGAAVSGIGTIERLGISNALAVAAIGAAPDHLRVDMAAAALGALHTALAAEGWVPVRRAWWRPWRRL